jgi:uncharacterized protein DUF4747
VARDKKLVVGAVNITIHPHSPERYLSLMRDVYKSQRPIPIAGDQYALLSRLMKVSRDQTEPGPITGDIFRFTDINRSAPWFNTSTNQFATSDELEAVSIPENLKPNSSRFSYIFFPENHLFFYEGYYDSKTLAPTRAESFIRRLFDDDSISQKYGKVDVTHIPSIDALSDALKIPNKDRIELVLTRPNPDTLADAEREVLERMNLIEVETIEQTYRSVPGGSIQMDADLETITRVSAQNGSVLIKGKDHEFKPVEYSTKRHPWTITKYYDPDNELAFEVFARAASSMKDAISRWLKK